VSSPGPGPVAAGLRLVAAERRTFAGPARYLDDPANRAALGTYLADLPGSGTPGPDQLLAGPDHGDDGQSYGEMAEALIGAVLPDDRPVTLLVLAYSIHDVQPGRATATYLSSVCPGTPLSFAICDQGSAAAFTGLRIARDYQPDPQRVLLIVLEQAGLPYPTSAARPAQHRGVALLFEHDAFEVGPAVGATVGVDAPPRLVGLRQRPGLAAAEVAEQAAADLADLSAGYARVRVLANPALAGDWPRRSADGLRIGPADQPATGLWWQLLDELAAGRQTAGPATPDLLVAADYDPELGYLCLAAFAR
jgi:hypothetical protein